jgi:hypothetical protein
MEAAIGAGIPLIVWEVSRAIVRQLGHASTIPRRLERIEGALTMLFAVNDKQNHIQQSTLEINKAVLDAIETGTCNGNIKSARERNDSALKNAKDAREKAQEFLIDHSMVGKGQ